MSYVLGIDVGAARTSAAVARPGSDDVEPVDLGDGGCGVASVLHLGADGSLDVGAAAERWADGEPERVVRGFPGRIGDDVPMLLAGEPWAPEELTAWLVRWVVDRVAEREDGPAAGIAVTRPATWDDGRIELLAGALAEAGPRRHLPHDDARRRVALPRPRRRRARRVRRGGRRSARPAGGRRRGGAHRRRRRTHGRARAVPGDTGSQDGRRPGRRPVRRRAGTPHPSFGKLVHRPLLRTGRRRRRGRRAEEPQATGAGRHRHPGLVGRGVGRSVPPSHRRGPPVSWRVRAPTPPSGRRPPRLRMILCPRDPPPWSDRRRTRSVPAPTAPTGRPPSTTPGPRTICSRRSAGSPAPSAPPTPRACCRGTRRRPGWHCPRPAAARPL